MEVDLLGLNDSPTDPTPVIPINEESKEPTQPNNNPTEFKDEDPIFSLLEPDSQKTKIIVRFEGENHYVSWYNGTDNSDVKEALMCACDSIMDSGFDLVDSNGKSVDFQELNNIPSGEVYQLYKGDEQRELVKALGDKWRKVKVEVEPLRHGEAQKCIGECRIGANLLKHTHSGNPHMRQFQLTEDMGRLVWYSSNKSILDSSIDLTKVDNILIGQKSPGFKKYPLPMLQHLSFSLEYKKKGGATRWADITCKDEHEFDIWLCALKSLVYHHKGIRVSKMELLGHSRVFNYFIDRKEVGESTKCFYTAPMDKNKKDIRTLEQCIVRKPITPEMFKNKLKNLKKKLNDVEDLTDQYGEDAGEDAGMEGGYRLIFEEEKKADDITLMKTRMSTMLDGCMKGFMKVAHEFDEETEKGEEVSEECLKGLEADIWKIEVDLENVKDILLRIKTQNQPTFKEKLKNLFPKIF